MIRLAKLVFFTIFLVFFVNNFTAMNLAAAVEKYDELRIIELIDKEKIHPDTFFEKKGNFVTPLLIAVKLNMRKYEKKVLVNYLLLSGANPYIKELMESGCQGDSPMEIAKRRRYKYLIGTMKFWAERYGYKIKKESKREKRKGCILL